MYTGALPRSRLVYGRRRLRLMYPAALPRSRLMDMSRLVHLARLVDQDGRGGRRKDQSQRHTADGSTQVSLTPHHLPPAF
jgi:hypothetical protein